MLARLAGRTHEVWTAVAIADGGRERVELSRSEVSFRAIDAREAAAYWRTGEPADKAGGYGIQGLGALFISGTQGQLFRCHGPAAVRNRPAARIL